MENVTPMLRQYKEIKAHHQDCILFFRLGDFYEMFYEDAKRASSLLDVVLTSRGTGKSGKIPMCGIPYHAADNYIARLIRSGQKVAICEQVEDPALSKGIVKREVTRVITSGTFVDDASSEQRLIISLFFDKKGFGFAFIDTIQGTIFTNEYGSQQELLQIISKLPLYECVYPAGEEEPIKKLFALPQLKAREITMSPYDDWCFNPEIAQKTISEHFKVHNMRGFGLDGKLQALSCVGALIEYLRQMNRQPMRHIDKVALYTDDSFLFISAAAQFGLGLEQLYTSIDYTLTPLGTRKLREWLYHPLKDRVAIVNRQKAVTFLKNNPSVSRELTNLLKHTPDVEKSIYRISCGFRKAGDLVALRKLIMKIPELGNLLMPYREQIPLFEVHDVPELRNLLESAVNPEVVLSRPEGNVIRKGYCQELDALRDIQENHRTWLATLQETEIKRTGINSLKIGYNKVFGYYIEVRKPNLHLVPDDYIRKQTLVNAERFITPELKEFEEKMLNAQEKIYQIETKIIEEICEKIMENVITLHKVCTDVARIDCFHSFSVLAQRAGYVCPEISLDTTLILNEARHPVVEIISQESFIPNDVLLDCEENALLIITGPNMAGKSTYIRQVALLVIMAQAGSYVPAQQAVVGIVDKIFTRIGAHDEITKGQSTFMVEMSETAGILHNLSPRSLVILDEIGRGTSTYDGLSLAWAISEYLQQKKVRTLFATHFHELTALADEFSGIKNYNVAVKEWQDEIVFLHKIVPGGTDDSYGIYVAQLAGIPSAVVERSKQILSRLQIHGNLQEKIRDRNFEQEQLTLFLPEKDPVAQKVKSELERLDINTLTPLQALNSLQRLKEMVNNGKGS